MNLDSALINIVNWLLGLLPRSPFRDFIDNFHSDNTISTALKYFNWFFPVTECLTVFSLWLAAVALFYLYSLILRWVKLIS